MPRGVWTKRSLTIGGRKGVRTLVLTGWGPRATSRGEGAPVTGVRGRCADEEVFDAFSFNPKHLYDYRTSGTAADLQRGSGPLPVQ